MPIDFPMSETDNSAVSGESSSSPPFPPITNLAQDDLFTILHLLPIDSILSFSMTCKRFRDLACSDGLWEAICRREWSPETVEALKSSARDGFAWMMLFERVCKLDSVCCHIISNPDGEYSLPSPRASHSLNFVADHLVLFGGGCEGGRHLDDTWTAYVGGSDHRMLKWKKVHSGTPNGRFGHTCIVVGQHLVLFGGINDRGQRYNDTWIGRVTFHEELSWKLLNAKHVRMPPRGAHAACCIGENKMVIHGGIGMYGVRLGDTWVLEISEDFNSGTWQSWGSYPAPMPRSGHSLTCIRDNQVVLFGGRGFHYDALDDVWLLDIQQHSKRWIQICYDLQNVPTSSSLPRIGHSATLVLGGRLLIYGGEDTNRNRKDDFWALDIKTIPSTGLQSRSVTLNGASAWRKLNGIPKCRSFHSACADRSGRYVYVFGGMVNGNGLLQYEELSELRFGGELFMVELVLGL